MDLIFVGVTIRKVVQIVQASFFLSVLACFKMLKFAWIPSATFADQQVLQTVLDFTN